MFSRRWALGTRVLPAVARRPSRPSRSAGRGRRTRRLAGEPESGKTYPVVGMCSVIMEFPQWNVL